MRRYRCDLCCHREKGGLSYDFCKSHKQPIPKENIEPPDFCYVWRYNNDWIAKPSQSNVVRTRWYKNGKLEK